MNAFKLLMAASCFLGLATSGVAKQDYSKSEGLLQYVDPYIGSWFSRACICRNECSVRHGATRTQQYS